VPDEPRRREGLLDPRRPLVRWGVNAWLVLGLVAVFVVGWHLAGLLRIVVFPLVLAVFGAAIVAPIARWLERHRLPPAPAALVATLALVVVVAGIVAVVTVQVSSQISGVADKLTSSYEQARDTVPFLPDVSQLTGGGGGQGTGTGSASGQGGGQGSGQGGGASDGGQGGGSDGASPLPDGAGQAAVAAVRGTLTFLVELLLGLVAVFFYVKDGDRIAAWLRDLFPPRHRADAAVIGAGTWAAVAGYIRGQAMIATVDGVLVAIGLLVLGIPLAVTLGVVVFVGAFVPVVGSIVAGAVAVLVALATEGFVPALVTLAIIVGVQQLEGNVLAPFVLGHELDLHPLAVLATITAGAVVAGPFGAIVAVPVTASAARAAAYLREQQHAARPET
jgi:predicted PurR-regulated permease PerM